MHSKAVLPISIIMPVYNEVPSLDANSLTSRIEKLLQLIRPCDEIVLVDGGSSDSSWTVLLELALHPQVIALQSSKGRALQMNTGAALSKGEVFLFLHADTVLGPLAWHALLSCLKQGTWGRFDVRIQGQSKWLPVVAWFMNHRSRLSKIGTGDQALFVGRALFLKVGCFPDQALMEDVEFCKKLKQCATDRFIAIRAPVVTSGRRWDTHGAWKTILLMWRFRFQYWRGVSAETLARQYRDTREKSASTVAVFAKYPRAGRVKTRLEPLLGAEQCAAFARYLLLSTLDKLHGVNVVLWTDGGTDDEWLKFLEGRTVQRQIQPDGHLGLRMQTAVETHLKCSEVVVLLGPDAVQFTHTDLDSLVLKAQRHSIAFVPALDGGYVALACTQCLPSVFDESIRWGTASVAEQTKSALQKTGRDAAWLPPQLDIDEPADLLKAIQHGWVPLDWEQHYSES